ncbi:CU044_5270 family protein [Nonomuraea sp. NPDC050790]|uniref:CU044_5270 family protein n=1 Tax=Nonomuraea sp. NPDC050790 TaxID=3364371 RepID=UPI0037983DCB
MNEFDLVNQARPDVPPYDPGTKAMARDRLVAAGRRRLAWRKPYTFAVAGALVLAVGAGAAVFLPAETTSARPGGPVVAQPKMALMSAEQVFDRAAGAAVEELEPRDDQYVVTESQTMYTSESIGEGTVERWLYRTKRKIWLRADGKEDPQGREGVLRIETIDPVAYPGWTIPEKAYAEKGTEVMPLVYCGAPGPWSKDYTTLKGLPTEPEAMKAWLYKSFPANGDKQVAPELTVWDGASELLRESYMPPRQRAALFKALGTLPGITVAEDAEDAAGRKGLGVGGVWNGRRSELIIDRESYALLGERSVVVEEKAGGAPVGSLLASTAQLKVSVSDTAPDAPVTEKESCSPQQGG